MLQYIQCLKSRHDLEILDFRERFREYAERMRELGAAVGATRVEASTTLAVDANLRVMSERGTHAPYDAVLEVYFPNATVLEALERPEHRARVAAIQDLQEAFVDLERSSFFFATVEID